MSLKSVMDNLILHCINLAYIKWLESILRSLLVRWIAGWFVLRFFIALIIEVFEVSVVRRLEYMEARIFITVIVINIRELSI